MPPEFSTTVVVFLIAPGFVGDVFVAVVGDFLTIVRVVVVVVVVDEANGLRVAVTVLVDVRNEALLGLNGAFT